jgi:hypothetical protein
MKEYRHALLQSLMGKSKLAQHACWKGHRMCWKQAKVLQVDPTNICRNRRNRLTWSVCLIRLVNLVLTFLFELSSLAGGQQVRKQ